MTTAQLQHLLEHADRLMTRIEAALPHGLRPPADWNEAIAWRLRRRATGCVLEPVRHVGTMRLQDLCHIDVQKEKIVRNTAQFIAGHPANNVLLTGARGTGKSSLVRACLHAFAAQGLRLIELDKAELGELPDIVDLLAQRPEKFILYCDDLSFEDGEPGYKALKSLLDGSVAAATPNMLVYATSNRRHLLPEYMRDNLSGAPARDDGEIHPGEAVEEKVSLSERFGLWISFYPFSQEEYLRVVGQWLAVLGLDALAIAAAQPHALVWALERGARNGRVAQQFARDYVGRLLGGSVPGQRDRIADVPGLHEGAEL